MSQTTTNCSRYQRGPVIPDIFAAVFCIEHGDHLYHGTAILPACQYATWPLTKIREKVKAGKLFFAELS